MRRRSTSCRYLYEIKDDLSAATATWLNEQPAAITVAGGELVVTFEDSPLMFVRSGTSGRYVRLSQSISATRIAGDGTTLFFIEGDSLYSVKMSGGAVTCLLTPGEKSYTDQVLYLCAVNPSLSGHGGDAASRLELASSALGLVPIDQAASPPSKQSRMGER